jgi:hypothetical protein
MEMPSSLGMGIDSPDFDLSRRSSGKSKMYSELFYVLFLIPNLFYGRYRKVRKGKTTDIHRLLGRAKEA